MMLVTGGVPSGEDFYEGRKKYIKELEERLGKQEVALIGPRRTGKTSIIQAYFEQIEKSKAKIPVYINLESCSTPYDIITEIGKKLLEVQTGPLAIFTNVTTKTNEWVSGIKGHFDSAEVTTAAGGVKINLRHVDVKKLEAMGVELKKLCGSVEKDIVIALDELPEAIWKYVNESILLSEAERIGHIGTLLSFFRDIRQTNKTTGKLRVIYSGSINFVETLKKLGFAEDHNDLAHFTIPFLEPAETVDIAKQLINGENILLEDPSKFSTIMYEQFGHTTPYYVQLYIEQLKNIKLSKSPGYLIKESELVTAYQLVLTTEFGPEYFYRRIETYHAQKKDMILKILKLVAHNQTTHGRASSADEIAALFPVIPPLEIEDLLRTLHIEDFFQLKEVDSFDEIQSESSRYYFVSKIIMVFWVRKLRSITI